MAEWVKALNKSDVREGAGTLARIGDQLIAVFIIEGDYYAIDNTCPHRGGSLVEGELDGCVVSCPSHGWEFNVTTGESPVNPAAYVKEFPIKLEGEDLLIEM